MLVIVLAVLEIIGYGAMWLNSRSFDWIWNRSYFRTRAMLMGNSDSTELPRYLSLPFLGYIPYPGYQKYNTLQHNPDGYRGPRIPLQKNGKLRVLCLGASTTYGTGVQLPTETYPAQLQILLTRVLANDSIWSRHYTGSEVINAGIEAGTSAEMLQQYLFKYRYYKPDIVIVHTGLNDAELLNQHDKNFQLDYTHYRRLQFHLDPLSQPARFLMHSYFVSFVAIRLFFDNFNHFGSTGKSCFTIQQNQTYCRWTTLNTDTIIKNHSIFFNPYYRNTKTLFTEIVNDSALLLYLPNALNPNDHYIKNNPGLFNLNQINIQTTQQLAALTGGYTIPFTYQSINNKDCWLDDCHLNAEGEKNKAQIVLPAILLNLRPTQK